MNQDKRIRENSSVLERIAMTYPTESPEHRALKLSAFAFAYVIFNHEKDFDNYVQTLHKPLTKKERLKLAKLDNPRK
jgi:hypothetical protein